MRRFDLRSAIVLAVAAVGAWLAPPTAAQAQPAAGAPTPTGLVLVELYTAQGCEACRPANLSLGSLAEAPGLLVLTFSVDHWDYLGWRDTFARPEFAARQRAYAQAMGLRGLKTPQVIVHGQHAQSGAASARVEDVVRRTARAPQPHMRLQDRGGQLVIDIARGPQRSRPADVWVAHYEPRPTSVTPARGEAAGAPVVQRNVVRDLRRIGAWTGPSTRYETSCPGPCAIIVQEQDGGRVLAVASHKPAAAFSQRSPQAR